MKRGRPIGVVRAVAVVALASALCGCAARRLPLDSRFGPHPAVQWVFEVGYVVEFGFGLPIYPLIASEFITDGAEYDGSTVLICNMGGATEIAKPSRAYVLDSQTGRIIDSITGPTFASLEYIVPDPPRAYFVYGFHPPRSAAFDLQDYRVDWDPPRLTDAETRQARSRHSWTLGECVEQPESSDEPLAWRYRYELDRGRALTIIRERQGLGFEVSWRNTAGSMVTRPLISHLSWRANTVGGSVIANDDHHLVFTYCNYAVSVNMHGLAASNDEDLPTQRSQKPER